MRRCKIAMNVRVKALRSVAPLAPKGMGKCAWTTGVSQWIYGGAAHISSSNSTIFVSTRPGYLTIRVPRRPMCTVPGPTEENGRDGRPAAQPRRTEERELRPSLLPSFLVPSFPVSFNECVHVRVRLPRQVGGGLPHLETRPRIRQSEWWPHSKAMQGTKAEN